MGKIDEKIAIFFNYWIISLWGIPMICFIYLYSLMNNDIILNIMIIWCFYVAIGQIFFLKKRCIK